MTDGTCLPRFKVAFIAKMATAGIANTFYESPMQPDDILGSDGSGVAGWFLDEASANLQITVVAAPEIWIDETWTVQISATAAAMFPSPFNVCRTTPKRSKAHVRWRARLTT